MRRFATLALSGLTLALALALALVLAADGATTAAVAAPPPPAADAGAAAVAAVLARAKEASGGKAWDAVATGRLRGKLHVGGLDGVVESTEDLRTGRYVSSYSLGPTTGAEGFDGTTVWSQDASGQVRAEGSEDSRLGAADEAYRRALAYWYPERWPGGIESLGRREESGRTCDGLRIAPRGGRPFELWVDITTGLVDHVVEAGGSEKRTTFLADYRQVGGVKVAFHQRSTNGDSRYDQSLDVESVAWNLQIPEGAFAMPAPPPPDFTLPGAATSITVPFQLLNNHIYLDVKLDGKGPFRVLCDTGGANIVTPEVAKTLGLAPQGALQGRGVGEKSEDVGLVKLATLEIGGAVLKDQVFAVFDLGPLAGAEGVPQNGLVGYEVFKRFVARVDYEHRTLTLTLPAAFSYHGAGVVVPFKFNQHVPQVEGALDGIAGQFDIDTGSRAGLDLLGPFVEQHGLRQRYAPKLEGVAGWGVGGPARAQFARAGSLRLGGIEIPRPVVDLTLQTKGAFADQYVAGNVGGALLSRFNVIFDYPRQQLIFERWAASDEPMPFDRAGLWLNLAAPQEGPPAFELIDVYAGSAAEKAGLRAGDRVLAVDGKSPAELPLPVLRQRLRGDPPGTAVRFIIERAGQRQELTVTLRDQV